MPLGEVIGAQFVKQEDGTLYASSVAVVAGGRLSQPRWGATIGRVEAIWGDRIQLKTRRGAILVRTDAGTRFRVPGVAETDIDDLRTGQIIGAAGHWEADGSLHAHIIIARALRPER